MSLQKLLSIPHIQSTIFQYLYAFDIGCDDLWEPLDYDTGDSAFKFCKAVSANIYIERDVMLNQLERELENIEEQICQTALLLYKINKNWVSISDTRVSLNKTNPNEKKLLELFYDYDVLEYNQEVIERMISGIEEFYIFFNLEYNKDYQPDYQF